MRRHLRNLAQQDRRELVVYGWLLAVSVVVAVTLAAVFAQISARHRAQAQTNAQTCAEVNYVVGYLNVYFTAATPAQLRIEQKVIDKAFPAGQVREVLDGILEAEIANPALGGLHPFILARSSLHDQDPRKRIDEHYRRYLPSLERPKPRRGELRGFGCGGGCERKLDRNKDRCYCRYFDLYW